MASYFFFFSLGMILYPMVIYPFFLILISQGYPAKRRPSNRIELPPISLIVIVRNGEKHIDQKIKNMWALDYPRAKIQLIIASDGSKDNTLKIIKTHRSKQCLCLSSRTHVGKAEMLNRAVEAATGKILIFTDSEALMHPKAAKRLAAWFQNPDIGGVCGRTALAGSQEDLTEAQNHYISYEHLLRRGESRIASVACNHAFRYAMDRKLFTPIPKSVTDDLYNALSVVKQGKTMVYDPEVLIKIPMRAKTISQEMTRRRRIVCRSMTGLKKMRSLFNPRQYGLYSWILFSHKLLRRALPLFLIMLWTANSFLIFSHWGFALLFIVQSTLYGLVPLHFIRPKNLPSPALTTWIYFCVGNVGTLMGLLEFLMGKRYEKWNPAKK